MNSRAVYQEGQMIGGTPYRVVRFLGAGGMGTVYEVEDTSIGKLYVLKTLIGDLAHRADLAEMLRQEARLLARVKHKNIVDVITAGKTSDVHGLPFLVMEKLDGITLKGLMQTHRLPWQFVRQIANELLEALYRMHHPGDDRLPMIHRDIKPENIFLAKDDDGKYITKLLDLGIASWLDGQKHQGFHGTLKYAAPEQLEGGALSERTDLYQAGLVVFEMLTGRHPFADARTEAEMIEASLMRSPPRVTEFVDVPRRVDEVMAAVLSKDPARRPRDAYLFMTALQDLREQPASRVPELANTTMEDLHTAIAKHNETGYEAYATAEGSTLEGMSAPPFVNQTLEDAYPSFAVASTDAPRAKQVATVPLAAPAKAAQAGVDRAAPTREQRHQPTPPRMANNDTEELLEGLMPADLAAIREEKRRQHAAKLPWTRETARSPEAPKVEATPRQSSGYEALTSSAPSTSTPLAAEVAVQVTPSRKRRGLWLPFAGAVVLFATGFGVVAVARRRSPAMESAPSPLLSVPVAQVSALPPPPAMSAVVESTSAPERSLGASSASATAAPTARAAAMPSPQKRFVSPAAAPSPEVISTKRPDTNAPSPLPAGASPSSASPPAPAVPAAPKPPPKNDFVRSL